MNLRLEFYEGNDVLDSYQYEGMMHIPEVGEEVILDGGVSFTVEKRTFFYTGNGMSVWFNKF